MTLSSVILQDQILDVHIPTLGKSFLINNIDWFCQTINQIFNMKIKPHRKIEYVLAQLKHTIGQNTQLIMKNDMKKVQIQGNEVRSSRIEYFDLVVHFSLISFNRYLLHGISSIRSLSMINSMEIRC